MYIRFNVNFIYTKKKKKRNHRNERPEKKIPFQNPRKNPVQPPFKGAQKNGNEGFFNNRVHRSGRLISQLNNTEGLCSSFTPIDPTTLSTLRCVAHRPNDRNPIFHCHSPPTLHRDFREMARETSRRSPPLFSRDRLISFVPRIK